MRIRLLTIAALLSAAAFAQPPRNFYPWWDRPIARDLNLTTTQRQQVRSIVSEYRVKLADARSAVLRAEQSLEATFDEDVVDQTRANQAIKDLAAARQNLTMMFSEMSLKLRLTLTPDQWRQLQQRGGWRAFPGGPGRQQQRGDPAHDHNSEPER